MAKQETDEQPAVAEDKLLKLVAVGNTVMAEAERLKDEVEPNLAVALQEAITIWTNFLVIVVTSRRLTLDELKALRYDAEADNADFFRQELARTE